MLTFLIVLFLIWCFAGFCLWELGETDSRWVAGPFIWIAWSLSYILMGAVWLGVYLFTTDNKNPPDDDTPPPTTTS
jgi:hypothetical protein